MLFDHEQNSSGADLAKLFVEVLHRCKAPIEVETVNRLATMLSRIPAAAPERQAFLVRAIAWSQLHNSESKKFEGHPKLHTAVADVYWKGNAALNIPAKPLSLSLLFSCPINQTLPKK